MPKWEQSAEAEWRGFLERLRAVRVLDPACGSGNFLYVTLRLLKDLEQEAIRWGAERLRVTGEFPRVDPHNVLGIEINPYARELAGVAIWIGHIQWMLDHGYGFPRDPVLQPLDNIELRDAILAYDEAGNPVRQHGLKAEFIVGNPPFLGNKRLRASLDDDYVDDLYAGLDDVVDRGADLACYWHELARQQIDMSSSRGRDCLRPIRFAEEPIGRRSTWSNRVATSSWLGQTNLGWLKAPRFASQSLARMTDQRVPRA